MELHVSVARSVFFSVLAYLPCSFGMACVSDGTIVLSFAYAGDCTNAHALFARAGIAVLSKSDLGLSFEIA
jgi:hypothetical protein